MAYLLSELRRSSVRDFKSSLYRAVGVGAAGAAAAGPIICSVWLASR